MSIAQNDNRVPLTIGEKHFLLLRNIVASSEECFEIVGEEGRGGSCIVYRAFVCTKNNERQRPVLLKEFYPKKFQNALYRESDTALLKLNFPTESVAFRQFQHAKENFLEICRKQAEFYLRHPADVDELVELQGTFLGGDSTFVVMQARGGFSWDKVVAEDESVFQICETILSVLRELKLYHNENLLHGDLKPENTYIFRKTRQHVALLDFGSVQNLCGNSLTGEEEISYSKKYAAPEVIKAYDKVGLDRLDYFRAITTKADLFSVGAMMFTKLTGKNIPRKGTNDSLKKKRAEILNNFWEHEKNGRVRNINATVKESLIKFFDGALARNPDSRFDAEEMKSRLVRLVNETAPPMTKLAAECKAPPPGENFVGRERELAQLNTLINRGDQIVFVNGEGGLGKSSLAQQWAWERRNDFEFFWTTFTDDLEQTIINLSTNPPYFVEGSSNPKDIFFHNLKCLRGYGDTAVLIIDNFDLPPEKMSEVLHGEAFAALTRLRMKIIFTCRHRPTDFASCVEVLPLSEDELLKLMRQYYFDDDLENYLPQIIRAADFNTLIVEQSAKMLQQSWGQLSPEKILEQLKNPTVGGAIFDKLKALYDLSELTSTAKKILAQAVLLPTRGINAAIFLRTHEEYQQDKIRILELSGWLKKSADNFISLHPLVREVCCKPEVKQAQSECRTFVENYSREISALSMPERISRRREQMEIVSNAADMLNDSDGQLSKTAGELNYLEGRARHAWHYYQEHWKIFLKLNPKPDTLEALEIIEKIAWSAFSAGEFAEAIHSIESALVIAERELNSDCAKLLPYYISFAGIYWRAGDLDKAAEFYATAIKLMEGAHVDDFTRVNLFINCGKVCLLREHDEPALSYGKRALEILNRRLDFPLTLKAETLEIFIEYSLRKNLIPAALEKSYEVAKISELFYGKENPITAESYTAIAIVLIANKNFNEALTWLKRARKILEDTCGQVHSATGKAYLCTALALYEKGEITIAYDWLAKASVIYEQTYGKNHPYTIKVHSRMFDWRKKMREF